ncbi:hypothetical protein DOY81_015179, partial [Sarcophaga bullata]
KTPIVKSSLQITSSRRCASEKKSNNQLDKIKRRPRFEICEDSKKRIEYETNDVVNTETEVVNVLEYSESYKTPKVPRTTTRSVKTTVTKSKSRIKKLQFINIDLTDSCGNLRQQLPATVIIRRKIWKQKNLNTNELIAQMQNLEIKSHKKSTKTTAETKTRSDSPLETPTPRTRRGRDKSPTDEPTDLLLLPSSTRTRRQRKLNTDLNTEGKLSFTSATPVSSTTSSRKRQKN